MTKIQCWNYKTGSTGEFMGFRIHKDNNDFTEHNARFLQRLQYHRAQLTFQMKHYLYNTVTILHILK
jgi:hypothetical protein